MVSGNHGFLRQDPSAIWHYVANHDADINAAAGEALDLRRQLKETKGDCVMFFWHMNTFAPIFESDSASMLVARYNTRRYDFTVGDATTILRHFSSVAGLGLPMSVKSA